MEIKIKISWIGRHYSQIHSVSPHSKDISRKEKSQANVFDEYKCRNSQQNISKPNTDYKKDHIPWSSWILFQDYSDGSVYTNQCDTPLKKER